MGRSCRDSAKKGRLAALQNYLPGRRRFIRIRRSKICELRNRSQRRDLFHRLMRRSILSQPDRIMREHERRRHLHQRRQPQAQVAHNR